MQVQSHPPNANLMGAEQIKAILHQRIEQADERFLQVIYAMVETYAEQYQTSGSDDEAIGYTPQGEPITVAELKAKINLAENQIDQGEFLTPEQLLQESQGWLSENIE
jgi:hypothetical protein